MSVGNQTQAIDFDKGELTLVLGENLDLGGDGSGSRNGTGKTTIVNALSYAIYGNALTNIKRDNLINKINGKGMLVSIDFEKDGVEYSIHRGRKPNVLKFTVNGTEQEPTDTDEAQGDSRETQKDIEALFGMSHDMFKHILALNTYTEPFLSMKNNDQRAIIEQLLGITMLSEKAEVLREKMKVNRDSINAENTRIETVKTSNERIEENIQSLERKQRIWEDTKQENIKSLEASIAALERIDIEAEIEAHKCWERFNDKKRSLDEAQRWMANITADNDKQEKLIKKLDKEIAALKDHKCYACGQELHDAKQDEILKDKETLLQEAAQQIATNETQYAEHAKIVSDIGDLESCPHTEYDSVEEAYNHRNTVESLQKELEQKQTEDNPYSEQIADLKETAIQEISFETLNDLTKEKEAAINDELYRANALWNRLVTINQENWVDFYELRKNASTECTKLCEQIEALNNELYGDEGLFKKTLKEDRNTANSRNKNHPLLVPVYDQIKICEKKRDNLRAQLKETADPLISMDEKARLNDEFKQKVNSAVQRENSGMYGNSETADWIKRFDFMESRRQAFAGVRG